jgi:hypothetical protein
VNLRPLLFVSVAFCLSLGGCDRAELMKQKTPAVDETYAKWQVELLRQRRFEEIQRELDSSISDANILDTLNTMAGMFPPEEPKSLKVVDLQFQHGRDSTTHTLALEYEFRETWLLVNISIKRMDGLTTIAAFNVRPMADSLESVNNFSLVGKSGLHYLMLGFALAAPIFCLYALVICLRTEKQNFKWLWAVFILFGVGRLAINWTTGELAFTPLAVHIPCGFATAVPAYGPWMVGASLPLGAILFMARRDRNTVANEVQSPPTNQLPPTIS